MQIIILQGKLFQRTSGQHPSQKAPTSTHCNLRTLLQKVTKITPTPTWAQLNHGFKLITKNTLNKSLFYRANCSRGHLVYTLPSELQHRSNAAGYIFKHRYCTLKTYKWLKYLLGYTHYSKYRGTTHSHMGIAQPWVQVDKEKQFYTKQKK